MKHSIPITPAAPAASIPLVVHFKFDCAWCWKAMYPGTPFPVGLSSTICIAHANWMAHEVGLRRQQKAQAAAQPESR